MANALRHIVAAAANALHEDDDDFQQIVSHTRRSFRRNQLPTPRRGRKSAGIFKRKTLLLRRANCDFCPIKTECEMLTSHGLGYSDAEPRFEMHWTKREIEDYICILYPKMPLDLVGFVLARMDRQKRLLSINFDNVETLKAAIGQSMIVIIPNRDLRLYTSTDNDRIQIQSPSVTRTLQDEPSVLSTFGNTSMDSTAITNFDSNLHMSSSSNPPNEQSSVSTRTFIQNHVALRQDVQELVNETNYFYNNYNENALLPIPTIDENSDTFEIVITRSKCVQEMFKCYEDEAVTQKKLSVSFQDELGVDGGGLTKEVFNLFFKEIENFYFQGEDCLVPYLPLNRIRKDKPKFKLIGRILEHMLLLTGSIPSKISKITLILIAKPNETIEKIAIVDEFFSFVNPCERMLLKKAIENFCSLTSKEKDVLINIFNSYHFFEMPSKEEIFDQIASIATNILIDSPKQFIDVLREGIQVSKYSSFWLSCDFSTLLDMQKPTPSKVANCLTSDENLTNEQANALHYFEMYVRCLPEDKIRQLVFLATGSYQMPDSIQVQFSNLVGLAQRPTFSTCTNTIQIPTTYSNYQELKKDFDTCITSEDTYIYTTY